ncbi:MAG: sugar phosphate isomerase/epimerase [Verrucomicrobiae bacterium]|nr:sugar phosphate isomerase/epimerase [Verrucomicrobiae bacterium]
MDWIGSPSVGVTLDYANTILFPNPPSIRDAIAWLGDRLLYVHLKNLIVLPDCSHIRTSLASGQLNNRDLLRRLKEHGYDGPICIEAPRPGDREWFAQQDLEYLYSLVRDMTW